MWLKRFTNFLIQSPKQSLLVTALLSFVPVVGTLSILIASFVTLCQGAVRGALFTLAATLPYLASFTFFAYYRGTSGEQIWFGMVAVIFCNVLTYVFSLMLKRHVGFSAVFQIAALLGVFIVSIVHLFNPAIANWWGNVLHAYYGQTSLLSNILVGHTAMEQAAAKKVISAAQVQVINDAKFFTTGLIISAFLVNAMVQTIIGRAWQCFLYAPGRLRRELRSIHLSPLAGVCFVAALGTLAWRSNSVITDMMPILWVLFCAAGFSLISYLFGMFHSRRNWIWVALVFIGFFVFLPTSAALVSALALIDIALDVRRRVVRL